MKKEIYITILLFALMLFALAVTVVRGQSIDTDQRKKIGFHAITNEHQIEMNPILPERATDRSLFGMVGERTGHELMVRSIK